MRILGQWHLTFWKMDVCQLERNSWESKVKIKEESSEGWQWTMMSGCFVLQGSVNTPCNRSYKWRSRGGAPALSAYFVDWYHVANSVKKPWCLHFWQQDDTLWGNQTLWFLSNISNNLKCGALSVERGHTEQSVETFLCEAAVNYVTCCMTTNTLVDHYLVFFPLITFSFFLCFVLLIVLYSL